MILGRFMKLLGIMGVFIVLRRIWRVIKVGKLFVKLVLMSIKF